MYMMLPPVPGQYICRGAARVVKESKWIDSSCFH
jgi:hypothetical protein